MSAQHATDEHQKNGVHHGKHRPYVALLVSLGASFVVMYAIMYSMADRWSHVYFNLSNVYMTGLMAGSMLPIMLATMPGMFKNRNWNITLWAPRRRCRRSSGCSYVTRREWETASSCGR